MQKFLVFGILHAQNFFPVSHDVIKEDVFVTTLHSVIFPFKQLTYRYQILSNKSIFLVNLKFLQFFTGERMRFFLSYVC